MARPRNVLPTVHVKRVDGTWQCYWSVDRKVIRRGCEGASTEAEAREVAARKFRAWSTPAAPTAAWTVPALLDAYHKYKTAPTTPKRDRAAKPESFHYNLDPLRPYFTGHTAAMLGPQAWNGYRAWRTAQRIRNAGARAAKANGKPVRLVSDASACRELNALRGALGWGRDHKWAGLEDWDGRRHMVLKDQETNPRHEFLTRAEFARLLAAVADRPHLDLFCRLGVATGARMTALLELTWDRVSWPLTGRKGGDPMDIAPEHGKAALAATDLAAPIEIDMGKGVGNKKRPSGLVSKTNVGLWKALTTAWDDRYWRKVDKKPHCDHVIAYHGKPIKSVDLSDAFERANIPAPKRTQHVLKHTCCSWLMMAGVKPVEIAKLVGTSAETIERHYGHLSPEHLDRIADVLSA